MTRAKWTGRIVALLAFALLISGIYLLFGLGWALVGAGTLCLLLYC